MSDALRRRLLDATLPHVLFDGWSERALGAGARDAAVEWPAARSFHAAVEASAKVLVHGATPP